MANKLTRQEMFDKVAGHLLRQGRKALARIHPFYSCAYRTPDGLSCAAGCLLDDAQYAQVVEGAGIQRPRNVRVFREIVEDLTLLSLLQHIHDSYDQVYWPRELGRLAFQHKLSPVVLHAHAHAWPT